MKKISLKTLALLLAILLCHCTSTRPDGTATSTDSTLATSPTPARDAQGAPKPKTQADEAPQEVANKIEKTELERKSGESVEMMMSVPSHDMVAKRSASKPSTGVGYAQLDDEVAHNTEEYSKITENGFVRPQVSPLSTFSIDVDHASYTNVRRMLQNGQMPYKDMVRVEEFVNYFDYQYPNPTGEHPFSIQMEAAPAPWNPKHQLVHVGLQGKKLDYNQLDPCNLVFLIDVSGSMSDANKLPLLKSSLKLLVNELNERDRVSIVVYANAEGLVLPPTPASQKGKIMAALDQLEAGGSTAGGAGIELAYQVAKKNYLAGGNNRIILATDGDFNVGTSSTSELVRLVEEKRKEGIFLTICGFGMGNYKDDRMEQLSNNGDGNYYYIDNINEARKVFVKEMRATLFTIAKDVKIQVEFNPAKVQAYRLIGYENRMLKSEDFNDDKKDAGELGAGHTVTALYEIIPVGVESEFVKTVDPLKYQAGSPAPASQGDELLTIKFRYKKPAGQASILLTETLKAGKKATETSDNFRFAAAVAEFGMLLRDSEFKGLASYDQVVGLATGAKGHDPDGYRREFIGLVENCRLLAKK
jgi:Ca-activated chloride channel homolog